MHMHAFKKGGWGLCYSYTGLCKLPLLWDTLLSMFSKFIVALAIAYVETCGMFAAWDVYPLTKFNSCSFDYYKIQRQTETRSLFLNQPNCPNSTYTANFRDFWDTHTGLEM